MRGTRPAAELGPFNTTPLAPKDLAEFVLKPGARGQFRLEAAYGHDDFVIAAALALLAADLAAFHVAPKPEPFAAGVAPVGSTHQIGFFPAS